MKIRSGLLILLTLSFFASLLLVRSKLSGADNSSMEEQIVAKEREGLDALKAGDVGHFGDLTADDAIFVDSIIRSRTFTREGLAELEADRLQSHREGLIPRQGICRPGVRLFHLDSARNEVALPIQSGNCSALAQTHPIASTYSRQGPSRMSPRTPGRPP
jgi:hypothetical protein